VSEAIHAISAKAAAQLSRALVVDPNPASAKMLAELLRSLIPNCQVFGAQTEERALKFLETYEPKIIFVEYKGPKIDGLGFTRQLRRSYLPCREAPVIVVTAEATAAAILGSRDAGVHEFLRRPFTLGDLKKRIDAVVVRPRDWIEAISYVGPDRRRFNSADYKGPRKRRSEGASPLSQRVGQAIKIVQSAAVSLQADPQQALRALKVQARILAELSAGREPLKRLEAVALALESYLLGPARTEGLSREQIETFATQLASAAPEEAVARAA
jgi:CheY-like chemotaxis protein